LSLFSKAGFEGFVSGLPGTSLHEQWDSLVAKVGGKVFCLYTPVDERSGTLAFKCSETAFEILSSIEGAGQAPYFAKRQWIAIVPDAAIGEAELAAYMRRAHRLIAAKLTRKLQAELGLSAIVAETD
jgi:predicted DNA-binding protein (MmcQ/YjbR family)